MVNEYYRVYLYIVYSLTWFYMLMNNTVLKFVIQLFNLVSEKNKKKSLASLSSIIIIFI